MVHLTLAVGDFLLVLLGSALWIGGVMAAAGALGLGTLGGIFFAVRKRRRLR